MEEQRKQAKQRQTRFELAGGVGRATTRTMRNYFEADGNYPPEVTNTKEIRKIF